MGGKKTNPRFCSGGKYNPYWEYIQKHVLRATAAGTGIVNNGREEPWRVGELEGSLQINEGLPCGLKMQLDFSLEGGMIRKKGKTKPAAQIPVLATSVNVLTENDSGF